MKYCSYCKIKVKGTPIACPLCQSPLQGENSPLNWPDIEKQKKASLLYKCVLFVFSSIIAILLIVDFFAFSQTHRHDSVPAILVLLSIFWLIRFYYLKNHSFSKIVFYTMLTSCVVVLYIGWFFKCLPFMYNIIIPCVVSVAIIVNFVFSFFDTHFKSNYLVYIIMNGEIGIGAFIIIEIFFKQAPISWVICLSSCVISLIGTIIFRNSNVVTEMQKRLHI